MKRILLLGAGGFIGKALCRRLCDKYIVRAFDIASVDELKSLPRIEMIEGDFVAMQDFSALVDGIDIIIHLISTTVPTEQTNGIVNELERNLLPTIRLLEKLVQMNKIPEMVFVSSGGTVYGESINQPCETDDRLRPICGYGMQKLTIENYIEFYGRYYNLPYKILRVANVYGMDENRKKHQGIIPIYLRSILSRQEIIVYGDGSNTRDYIYISDLINAIELVLHYTGQQITFNIGSGVGYTINEVIRLVEQETKLVFPNIIYASHRKCDLKYNVLNMSKTNSELKWRHQYTLEAGIREILSFMTTSAKIKY